MKRSSRSDVRPASSRLAGVVRPSAGGSAQDVLNLQCLIGNRATARLFATSTPVQRIGPGTVGDPHGVLGVSKDASRTEIRAAYKRLALQNHPDKGGDTETFKKILDAYQRLTGQDDVATAKGSAIEGAAVPLAGAPASTLLLGGPKNTLLNNVPSTGMGKFDAHYVPDAGLLNIVVKINFDFTGAWQDADKKDFKKRFMEQAETGWSGKYQFQCTKPGQQHLVVTPMVSVQEVDKKGDSHYAVEIGAGEGRAMVGRQGSQPGTQFSGGFFYKNDVNSAPHKSQNIRCTIATHEATRMEAVLAGSPARTVFFEKGSATVGDSSGIEAALGQVLRDKLPGAPKVPFTATGFLSKGEAGGLFSKERHLDKARASAVARVLKQKLPGYDVREFSGREITGEAVAAAKQKKKSKRMETRKEGAADLARAKRSGKLESGGGNRKVELGIDKQWASTFQGDAYSVAVHEFGHMLGNPDEYFSWGPKTLDSKIAQLLESGDPKKMSEGVNLDQKRKNGKVELLSDSDKERADIQGQYAALVKSAGLEIPYFGSQNSSLMSAGTDLLPRHYVAMWEALGRITDPDIKQSEWKIT